MTTVLDDTLARLNLMQKAVVSRSDAVPVFYYAQESFPFWVNRVNSFTTEDIAIDLQCVTYVITMRLILSSITSGIEVEAEQSVHTWLPTVLQYFGQRRQLKRTNADDALAFLDARGALIRGGVVDYNLQVSGIGNVLFGIDFEIEVPIDEYVDQVIF